MTNQLFKIVRIENFVNYDYFKFINNNYFKFARKINKVNEVPINNNFLK